MPSMPDVQPIRSLAELRADVEHRAARVRRRDRLRVAVPATIVAVVLAGIGLSVAGGSDENSVRTIDQADQEQPAVDDSGDGQGLTGAPEVSVPTVPSDAPGGSAPDPAAQPDPGPSPTGSIFFSSNRAGTYDLYSVSPDGSGLRQLTSGDGDDLGPTVSPNGRLVAFRRSHGPSIRYDDARIFVMRPDGSGIRELPLPDGIVEAPTWAPGSDQLAFVHDGALWVAAVDGSNAHQLTSSSPAVLWPAWSPDGREIAYTAFDGEQTDILALDLETDYTRTIATGNAVQPAWSPDGRFVAFRKLVGSVGQVHVVGRDGTGQRQLVSSDAWDSMPRWSPDGRALVFDRDQDGHDPPSCFIGVRGTTPVSECLPSSDGPAPSNLWIVGVDGSGARRLTSGDAVDVGASWGRT